MEPVIRAIDIGYGNTKYVVSDAGGQIQCDLFPSVAPLAASKDLASGVLQPRDTVVVVVNGARYEIGRDAPLALRAQHSRKLDAGFAQTDAYLALMRGALAHMRVDEIHLLVVGLPVSTFGLLRKSLEERLCGQHPLPGRKKCRVHAVRVLPQPIGGFFDYAIESGLYGSMKQQVNLVIDPGYFTLDWLTAQGIKPIDARSGSYNGGMATVLHAIRERLALDLNLDPADLDPAQIDQALCGQRRARFFGREYDLKKYLPLARKLIQEAIGALAQNVGHGSDIDNILLVGGGAPVYLESIQKQFPRHHITLVEEPVFANVRGFQRAGAEWLKGSPGIQTDSKRTKR